MDAAMNRTKHYDCYAFPFEIVSFSEPLHLLFHCLETIQFVSISSTILYYTDSTVLIQYYLINSFPSSMISRLSSDNFTRQGKSFQRKEKRLKTLSYPNKNLYILLRLTSVDSILVSDEKGLNET